MENKGWYIKQAEPVFESERQELLDMNRAPPNKNITMQKEFQPHVEAYQQWKNERENRLA